MGNAVIDISKCEVIELNLQDSNFLFLYEKQTNEFPIGSRSVIQENQIAPLLLFRSSFEKLEFRSRTQRGTSYA